MTVVAGAGKRCAVIDIGSNTATLALYRRGPYGYVERLEERTDGLRLVRRLDDEGRLPEGAFERATLTVTGFARHARERGVERIEGVATSAIRDAVNGEEFAARLAAEAHVPIRVLDGVTEARVAAISAVNTLPLRDGLVFDLGGGSLQLARVVARRVTAAVSLPLGGLRISGVFLTTDPPGGAEIVALRRHVDEALSGVPWLAGAGALVGMGGTVRTLARLDRRERRWPVEHAHGYRLAEDGVLAALEVTSRLPAEERTRLSGLAEHRVDSIVAGTMVIACLLRATAATGLRVSGYGLREGVAWGLLHGGRSIADVRKAGARGHFGGGASAEGAVLRAEAALRDHARAGKLRDHEHHALALALRVTALGAPPGLLLRTPLQGYLQEEVLMATSLLGAVPDPVDARLRSTFDEIVALARVRPRAYTPTAS